MSGRNPRLLDEHLDRILTLAQEQIGKRRPMVLDPRDIKDAIAEIRRNRARQSRAMTKRSDTRPSADSIKALGDRATADFKLLVEANDTIQKLREDRATQQATVDDLNKKLDECMLRGAAMQARIAELERAEAERPWAPTIGDRVMLANPERNRADSVGIVIQYRGLMTLNWRVRWSDDTEFNYAADELKPESKP